MMSSFALSPVIIPPGIMQQASAREALAPGVSLGNCFLGSVCDCPGCLSCP